MPVPTYIHYNRRAARERERERFVATSDGRSLGVQVNDWLHNASTLCSWDLDILLKAEIKQLIDESVDNISWEEIDTFITQFILLAINNQFDDIKLIFNKIWIAAWKVYMYRLYQSSTFEGRPCLFFLRVLFSILWGLDISYARQVNSWVCSLNQSILIA